MGSEGGRGRGAWPRALPAHCVCVGLCPSPSQPPLPPPQLSALPSRPWAGRLRHTWAHPHCQLCSDATLVCRWRCQPCLAQPPPRPPSPGACWALHPTAQGLRGQAGRGLSYPGVSGPCPPAADALQTHSTVFQEHTGPSSPSAGTTARGFRRASEVSIASQVSGMAESYTASSIAQSE